MLPLEIPVSLVEIGDGPRFTETIDAEGVLLRAERRTQPGEAVTRGIVHAHDGSRAFVRRNQTMEMARRADLTGSRRRSCEAVAPAAVDPVGAGEVDHARLDALVVEVGRGGDGLRRHHARGHDRHRRPPVVGAVDDPVAAEQHVFAESFLAQRREDGCERRLVDRSCRQAEIGAGAAGPGELVECVAQQPVDLGGVGRLGVGDVREFRADRRRDRRLMGAALGCQRHARRCAGDDELGVVVDAVDERIETTQHERVVDGADREEVPAVVLVAQPELAEQHEQVHLADAELDVLARRPGRPLQQAGAASMVGALGVGVDATLVDPAAEVRGDRDVGRRGDDSFTDAGHVGEARQAPVRRPPGSTRRRW